MELLDSTGVASNARARALAEAFERKFESRATFVARAPGRVNLIGEHIDYCGYSVLPMAIEQDVMMAVSVVDDGRVFVANTNPMYAQVTFSSVSIPEISVEDTGPSWHQYFLCGYRGILESLSLSTSVPMRVLVDGIVPPSAGLSSSSAMVVCGAIATLWANLGLSGRLEDARGIEINRKWIADVCTKAERYIGTQGGGMDQAICLLATAGTAKRIDFDPLNTTDVSLPRGGGDAVFVITNSLVKANKAAFADFNVRVVECRLAAKMLARHLGLERWTEMTKLRQVQDASRRTLEEMLTLVDGVFHQRPYTKSEIMRHLDFGDDEESAFDVACLTANTRHVTSFELRQRATHVYSEVARVYQFQAICEQADGRGDESHLRHLGELMDQSHASCRDLYRCSCEDLDRLVASCRGATASHLGAVCYGSRLTGAGWGGCCVSLVKKEGVQAFVDAVDRDYYITKGLDSKASVIVSSPSAGAAVLQW